MSSDRSIRVENLGKRYRIGTTQGIGRYRSLREEIVEGVSRGRRTRATDDRDFWALRDVSFETMHGETVGIIGRNGAGKSTLLKILARITPPTSGRGETYGRVGSLLEVGTGFHLELTGRENIMLSGAIMGLRRAEVQSRFDEIVEFSGLASFLDTPVKRYSTGMYMRLAFSVAAHLEPEILLVDEVLAVGDAEFQKKCLGRMEELGGTGRTVVFVSHSMPSILRLCPRVLLFDNGSLLADGSGAAVVEAYMGHGGGAAEREWTEDTAPGDEHVRLRAVRVTDAAGSVKPEIDIREPLIVEVEYSILSGHDGSHPVVVLEFMNMEGVTLFATHANRFDTQRRLVPPVRMRARCTVPGNLLSEGGITVLASIASYDPLVIHAIEREAVVFTVVDPSEGDSARGAFAGDMPGVLRPLLEWEQGPTAASETRKA
jgi:lipopolysaccharide transport system ATP-binding protein